MVKFTSAERMLIEHARKKALAYCKMRKSKGLTDNLIAFVLSSSGKIYAGQAFDSGLPQCNICAERHAVANMVLAETEKARIVSVFVAGPVPGTSKRAIAPCGMCRHVINELGTPKTTVICSEWIRKDGRWQMFPRIDKYLARKLYPNPYIPVKWE